MDIEDFVNRKLTKVGEMPNGDNIYWITEKSVNAIKEQLRIGSVVKSFYCFEQSMNGYDKCGDQCNYCKSLNIAQ